MELEKVVYTAEVVSSGEGRNGHVLSSDGLIDTDVAMPVEMGGKGGHPNPEQFFAAGYAACFHNAMLGIGKRSGIQIDRASTVTAQVGFGPLAGSDMFGLVVTLLVYLPGLTQDEADDLVARAHARCPYSNATRGNVDVAIEVSVA